MEVQLKEGPNLVIVVETTFKNTHTTDNLPKEAQPKVLYKPMEEEHTTEKNREQPGFDRVYCEELRLYIESNEP